MSNKKVTSNLMGGLGNYLFQIAAAYGYALKYGYKPFFNPQTSKQVHRSIDVYLENILRNIDIDYNAYRCLNYSEPGFNYTEIPDFENMLNKPKFADGVHLIGYYQNSKYFEGFDKEIKELFSCDEKTKDLIHSKYPCLKTGEYETCAIHVRRGDYVNLQDTHPVQGLNYFMKAVRKMPKDCHYMIFSDDPQWCKDNFEGLLPDYKVVEGQSDIEDLYTMSMCDHNVICNSTLSWWAAFLNNNKKQIVDAPKK